MFREMRRKRQALSPEENVAILNRGTSGVLAVSGDDGSKIYFHCAKSGHKLDAIKGNNKVSFCVIDQDHVVPERYTSYFRSVIVFGKIRVLDDDEEKRAAIEKLALKYAPNDTVVNRQKAIEREWNPLCMLEMTIDHMTGKKAIELVNENQHN